MKKRKIFKKKPVPLPYKMHKMREFFFPRLCAFPIKSFRSSFTTAAKTLRQPARARAIKNQVLLLHDARCGADA